MDEGLDFLGIYPLLSVDERYGKRKLGRVGGNLPPLGLAYVAAYLRARGYRVGILDATAFGLDLRSVLQNVASCRPRAAGISAMTPIFSRASLLASELRKAFPDMLILLGGHHATILPVEVLSENPAVDILIIGEGEETALKVMELYSETGYDRASFLSDFPSLAAIRGIAYREDAEIKINGPRKPLADLDSLPYPARDLLPMKRYIPLPNQYLRLPVLHMTATRGCPYDCSFCSNNSVFGRKVRLRSPESLVDEILTMKAAYGIREVSFWDDTLTFNRRWLMEVCEGLLKKGAGVSWTGYARANNVDRELLSLMKRAGCWNLFYGFESGNQDLLDIIGKGTTLEMIKDACRWTKEAGIEVRASFMLALPGETPEKGRRTVDFAVSLDPEYVQFSLTTPYPGTRLCHEAHKYGTLLRDYSQYNMWEPVFIPYGYSGKEEITKMQRMAIRRFYFRPRYVFNRLKSIHSLPDLVRHIKGFRMAVGFVR